MSEQTYKVTFELKDGSIISSSNRQDRYWTDWVDDRLGEIFINDDSGKNANIKIDNTKRIIIDHPQFKIVKDFKSDKKENEPKEEQTTLTTLELINKINSMANKHSLTIEEIAQAVNALRMIKNKDSNI